MNHTFQRVSFIFFLGFGAFYLTADFLINQSLLESDLLKTVYTTFDMPFFFSAGLYLLSSVKLWLEKNLNLPLLGLIFWALAALFAVYLLSINLGYISIL